MMILNWLSLIVSLIFVFLSIILLIRDTAGRMSSREGINKSGIQLNTNILEIKNTDLRLSSLVKSETQWLLLIFADKPVIAIPEISNAIDLSASNDQVSVIILARGISDEDVKNLTFLHPNAHFLSVKPTVYDRFRINAMPFGMLATPSGQLKWQGIINSKDQLEYTVSINQMNFMEN